MNLPQRSSAPALALALITALSPLPAQTELEAPREQVQSFRITILSTMLADRGIGEWGFAALVEADGRRILFDTGQYPDTVLRNAEELGVSLEDVTDVVLSHNHWDHTGGLVRLRQELGAEHPGALATAHVGQGIFWPRPGQDPDPRSMANVRTAYEELGGSFRIHEAPVEIQPGVWLTGPVPRQHPERNWSGSGRVHSPEGVVEDTIPESMSLVLDTEGGLVVVSGCGHAGIVNILEYSRAVIRDAPIRAALGGFHLARATDEHLTWTAQKLKGLGLQTFVGAHCTGLEPVYRFRELVGLGRDHAVVGAVGATYSSAGGLDPLVLAH